MLCKCSEGRNTSFQEGINSLPSGGKFPADVQPGINENSLSCSAFRNRKSARNFAAFASAPLRDGPVIIQCTEPTIIDFLFALMFWWDFCLKLNFFRIFLNQARPIHHRLWKYQPGQSHL